MNLRRLPNYEINARMEQDGVKKVYVSFRDTLFGKRVLSYDSELSEFTYMNSLENNPRLTVTRKLRYQEGFDILEKLFKGDYKMLSVFYAKENVAVVPEREEESVEMEVAL